MSAKSDYLENLMLDHLFRTRTWSKPTNVWVGLLTAAPNDAGGGTEVSGGSYARVQVSCADASWTGTHGSASGNSSGTGGQISNANAITFPAPSANWGEATHFGIYDAASSGNLLYHGALTQPKTINSGDAAPSFPAGALTITEA